MAELLDCLFSSDIGKLAAVFEKINVNCVIPGTDGCTPLHVVAGMENSGTTKNLISFLLKKGANPNSRSFEKLTPVHIAAMWNNCFQLEKLLQNGGNPWLTDCGNKNSFDMAADNDAYEAYHLLNTYLHEDRLQFKKQRKSFSSSKAMVNNGFAQSKNEYSRSFSNTMFMTANENFPLILSSFGSCDESSLNMSECIKETHSSKYNQAENDSSSSESISNISKCIKRNCSKHNQVENDSSDESVWNDGEYIKRNHSLKHNQNIEAENDSSGKNVLNISKCFKGNYSSKYNQAESDSSKESVLYFSKYIEGNSLKHNQNNQSVNDSSGESVLNISKSIKGKQLSKYSQNNQVENDSSEESVIYISKCIKGNYSKHSQDVNDSSRENIQNLSKCIKGNCSLKSNQAKNESSDESVMYVSKYVKGNHSSKYSQAVKSEDNNYSNTSISKPKLNTTYKLSPRSVIEQFSNSTQNNYLSKCIKGSCSLKPNQDNQAKNESDESVLYISKYVKENHSSKYSQTLKAEDNNYSNASISKPKLNTTFELSPRSVIEQCSNSAQNNLHRACYFSSSESETSDIPSCTLNYSDDSSRYETIIDSDDKSGIVLVEIKDNADNIYSSDTSVSSVVSNWKSFQNVNDDCSTLSCSLHSNVSVIVPESLLEYSNCRIYQELLNLGDNPGPVLDNTRHVYLLRLARLKTGCMVSCELPKPKYCMEIYQFIENKLDMIRARTQEQIMAAEFETDSSEKWREGNQRCCFNYFLLDPRVTQNLPARVANLTTKEAFLIFLDSLFYVGKGTRGRPYSHLYEAAKLMETKQWKSAKITHILEIWKAGLGVISLHCFHNSIPVEAYTREACILEAIGMSNLTNIRKGNFYGSSSKLTPSRKRLIGISLLEKALQIFLLEGERQIKPKDVQNK